jgi:hypothetical protein
MIATPVGVLAVDDAPLVRVQLQTDCRQPRREAGSYLAGLLLAVAVNHRVIAVAFEGDRRKRPSQPYVKRVVQLQVRQDREGCQLSVVVLSSADAGGGRAWRFRGEVPTPTVLTIWLG